MFNFSLMRQISLLAILVALFTLGCSDDDDNSNPICAEPTSQTIFDGSSDVTLRGERGIFDVTISSTDPLKTGEDNPNSLQITVKDLEGNALTGASGIKTFVWMSVHGHGSHQEPAMTEIGEGVYEIENLVFHMMGQWQVRFFITEKKDGKHDEVGLTIKV